MQQENTVEEPYHTVQDPVQVGFVQNRQYVTCVVCACVYVH